MDSQETTATSSAECMNNGTMLEKTSTPRRNGRTVTSILHLRVTHPREVRDILRKPVRPDVTSAQQQAAYNGE